MTEIARLQIAVDSRQVRGAQKDIHGLAGVSQSATSALNKVGASLVAGFTLAALNRVQKLSEEFVLLNARVSRLSADSESASVNYGRLLDIAGRTGATLGDTVKLWESLTGTLRELGGTDNQVLRLTETLQKIGAVGGSSAEDMANALRQLGQGLAGGIIRAEEFNSVVEGMPELAREIARGLGVPFGELRKLLLDGELTAEKVLGAIQKRTAEVDAEFAKLPRTVSQASNALVNDLGGALAELDKQIGASAGLAAFFDVLAKGVRLSAGLLTDFERLKTLEQERAVALERIDQINRRTLTGDPSRIAAAERLKQINDEILKIQDRRIKQQKEESKPITGGQGPQGDATSLKALETLKQQAELARLSGAERAKQAAIQKLGAKATEEEKQAAAALAVEIFNLENARKSDVKTISTQIKEEERLAGKRKQLEGDNLRTIQDLQEALIQAGMAGSSLRQRQAELSLNQYATPEQVAIVRELAAALAEKEQAEQNKQLLGQVDPIAGEQQKFQQELENLRLLNESKLIEDQRYLDLKGQAERAHDEQMRLLQEENFRRQSVGNQIVLDSLNALESAGTNAMVGLLTGTMDSEQAMQALGGAILNSAVGALVEVGVQYLKNLVIGQAASAGIIATGAATGTALAAAYAPAAALASLASFGANAAPASAGIASTMALSQGLALASFEGGGFTGSGPRTGGVDGRGGFNAILHPNETVIDHTKGQTMGGGVTVNVIESSERAGQQDTRTNADGTEEVDVFVADIFGDGPRARAMQTAFGLQRAGR